jgi:hypothetical protein
VRIRDPGWKKFRSGIQNGKNLDPGWKKFGFGIRDVYPGSATLHHTYSIPVSADQNQFIQMAVKVLPRVDPDNIATTQHLLFALPVLKIRWHQCYIATKVLLRLDPDNIAAFVTFSSFLQC